MKVHAFRLHPGDDLRISIQKFVEKQRIRAAVTLACVGSLSKVVLRMANAEGPELLEGKHEIISMEGTLSVEGSHIHIAVSGRDGAAKGGHLLEGCIVFTTAEIVIGEIDTLSFARVQDQATGYRELEIKSR